MTNKTPMEKLTFLVPHWIEHTEAHIEEMREWQTVAASTASPEAAGHLAEAIEGLRAATESLARMASLLPHQEH